MNLKLTILSIVCAATPFVFKKESAIENNGLYGKWRLTEVYDEYAPGEYIYGIVFQLRTHTI